MSDTATPTAALDPGDDAERPTLGRLAEQATAYVGELVRRAGVDEDRPGALPVARFQSAV
ncbi:hypothetical protein OG535_22550 [Kitasatospora sp. NBC_00085]|uniref:hypothetical protein n=1 Tax=unclassified Kitasatospora TaxID=2633591 RepID=UPI00324FB8DB